MSVPATSIEVNPWLFANPLTTVNGGPDGLPIPTQVNGINASALIELQSTTQAFLLPRMTTAQIAAITTPVNGMIAFNSSVGSVDLYTGGGWDHLMFSANAFTWPTVNPASSASFLVSSGGVVTYDTQTLLTTSGTLSAAQMTNINTASVQVLAAAPAGFFYEVQDVLWNVISTGHTAFATGGNVYLQYNTGAANTNYASALIANTFFQNATNFAVNASGNINGTTGLDTTLIAAKALAIGGSANFTAGAGSSVNYVVRYRVVPIV